MTEAPFRIGVLDVADLPIEEAARVAQNADRLGFSRYWITEHFGEGSDGRQGIAYTNPLLAATVIAGVTQRIRVGVAGILAKYYSPVAVARDAIFIENTFGRFDLGLAAGNIPPPWHERFMDGRPAVNPRDDFAGRVREVAKYLDESVLPSSRPPIWLLGTSSSTATAELAASIGANFALSIFHAADAPDDTALRRYRELAPTGSVAVALGLLCVENDEDCRLSESPRTVRVQRPFIGTPGRCRDYLESVARRYRVEELCVVDMADSFEQRMRSLGALAAVLALGPSA